MITMSLDISHAFGNYEKKIRKQEQQADIVPDIENIALTVSKTRKKTKALLQDMLSPEEIVQGIREGQIYGKKEMMTLIAVGRSVGLAIILSGKLDQFVGLDHEVATRLIEMGYAYEITWYLDKFIGIKPEDRFSLIINTICNADRGDRPELIAHVLGIEIDQLRLALKLITKGFEKEVLKNLRIISHLNHKKITTAIIIKGKGDLVAEYISDVDSTIHEYIAKQLIKVGGAEALAKNITKFNIVDLKKILIKLIKCGAGYAIASNIGQIDASYRKEISMQLIRAGCGWSLKFNDPMDIDMEIGLELIKMGQGWVIIDRLDTYIHLGATILDYVFPSGMTKDLLNNMRSWPDGDKLINRLYIFKRRYPHAVYAKDAQPIISSQGTGAARFFDLLHSYYPDEDDGYEDMEKIEEEVNEEITLLPLDFFVGIAKRSNVHAYGYIKELALPLVEKGYDFSNTESQNFFYHYMQTVGLISSDIYERYQEITREKNIQIRALHLKNLQKDIADIQHVLVTGDENCITFEKKDPMLFSAVLYSTFPPATGISKDQMYRYYRGRDNAQYHVEKVMKGHETQIASFSEVKVKTGMLTLSSGEELDMKHWVTLSEVIREVHKEKETLTEDLAQVGKQLVSWYMNPAELDKKSLWKLMYTHEVLHGRTLAEQPGRNIEELMQYKEFIGDRIKSDYVREAMEAYRKASPVEYGEFLTMVASRIQLRNPQAIALKIWGMAHQYREKEDPLLRKKFEERWEKDYGLTVEEILGARDEKELGDLLVERSTKDIHEEATRLVGVNLVKDTNNDMRRELDKFSFHEDVEDSGIPLHFEISKRKAHGVAGFNMGVCVAPDKELWNTPEFMNVIAFDAEKKVAMGGMHFYFVDYEGKRYLSLPGINPSIALLAKAEAKEVYETFLTFAKRVAKELGCVALWIPESGNIHSNRSQIKSLITGAKYTKVPLKKTIPFSYDPHKYHYDKVYEISLG